MTNGLPKDFAPYIGFTEEETYNLCEKYIIDFQKVKEWYNGYNLNGTAIYNPLSAHNFQTLSALPYSEYRLPVSGCRMQYILNELMLWLPTTVIT